MNLSMEPTWGQSSRGGGAWWRDLNETLRCAKIAIQGLFVCVCVFIYICVCKFCSFPEEGSLSVYKIMFMTLDILI